MLNYFANPLRLNKFFIRIHPWLVACTFVAMATGLYYALLDSPADYQQGEYVRIMYIHVPAAWLSLGIYSNMAICSLFFLVWRHPTADLAARHSAVIAMVMTVVTLVTGSLWGKPTWGTYWVWDARLTSMLILLFILLGYHMLARQSDYDERRQKACAIFCLFGAINLPIIKFSVEWWNTLHQPASILRTGGIAIDPAMQVPLWLMAVAFFLLYLTLLSLRLRTALLQAKVTRLQHKLIRKKRKTA